MRFLATMLLHTGRNLLLTWKSQLMSFFTVLLSVLIFSFSISPMPMPFR